MGHETPNLRHNRPRPGHQTGFRRPLWATHGGLWHTKTSCVPKVSRKFVSTLRRTEQLASDIAPLKTGHGFGELKLLFPVLSGVFLTIPGVRVWLVLNLAGYGTVSQG